MSNNLDLGIIVNSNYNGVKIYKLKLEKGNKATDWTPAPEDVEQQIKDQELFIEYSADANNWHTIFTNGDIYLRQKKGANGTWGTAIKFVGKDGTSVTIKGNVATSGNLPTSGIMVGDGYITDDTGHLWIYTASGWIDAGQIKGDKGQPSYFHTAYADDASGNGFSQNPAGKAYMGTYADNYPEDSDSPSAYNWVKVKGDTGAQGQSVSSYTKEYYLSTSNTMLSGGTWSSTPPSWESGKFMWQREKITWINPSNTTYSTPFLDNALNEANQRVADLENKTDFLTGTTIEGNAVATGTLLVGDENGTNAMICGITDQPNGESIRFAAGKPYAQKYLSPFQVLDNGMVRFVNPVTGQKTFELGYNQATGKVVFDIYDENGVKIATIGSQGITFTGYIQESFDTQFFTKLETNTFEESAIINSFKTTLRKRIVTNDPRTYSVYMVSNKTAYLYDAGRNFETSSNIQYIGYHNSANKFDSFIDNGIYMVMAQEELFNASETVYYMTTAYKMVNGKVNDAMYITVVASLKEINL